MSRFTHPLCMLAFVSGICLAISGAGAMALAQESAPAVSKPTVSPEQLEKWLAELDSESFEVREAAAEKLSQAGPAAVDVLASGIVSESAETAWRSGASLERIALTSDEKTLARITNVLDTLSAKGKPGLRTMAAEMHVRQKHFRHDRAVASLKQNGAVFAGEGMELGGGPVMIGGAIAMGGPVFIEEIREEVIEVAPALEPVPAPAKPEEGIFGLIGRILGGGAKAADEPLPKIEIRDAIPDEVPQIELPLKEIPAPAVEGAPKTEPAKEEPAEEIPADEKPGEPAQVLKEFEELAKPAKVAAPAGDQALAPPPALIEAVEVLDGADVAMPIALDFIGGGIVGFDEGEEVSMTAALVLGKQWKGGDDGLKVLKDVPEIWSVSLHGAKITDAALQYIAELPNLNNLQVRETAITRQGLKKLREQKPNLQLQARGEAMMGINADIGSSPLLLTSIFPESGAYQAGLREGDVIHKVDGVAIKDFADLTISVYGHKAGDKVRVEYQRDGAKKSVDVTLKKRADDQ